VLQKFDSRFSKFLPLNLDSYGRPGKNLTETRFWDWIEYPHTRIRVYFETSRGEIESFLVQLEHQMDEEWMTVARFDHNPKSRDGHDINDEGLHLDLCGPSGKQEVRTGFPDVPLKRAVDYCERYMKENAEALVRRFEEWHEQS